MNDASDQARVPFQLPEIIKDGFRMGRGIIRIVPVPAANTDITVEHNLARVPNVVLILDSGLNYQQWRRGSGTWTQKTISIQFSNTGTVTIWIV